MQKLKTGFQAWRNRTTIRKQLSIFVGLAVTLTIALLVMFNYLAQTHANVQSQKESLTRVLELENQRLDGFVDDLRTFSLQLRGNSGFMAAVAGTKALDYEQRVNVESALKTAYYARGDLLEAELYLVRQKERYAIESQKRKVMLTENVDVTTLEEYATFTAKPNFYSISPDARGLLRFTRTIIDAPHTTPLAIMRFTVSLDAIAPLLQNHQGAQELLCILGTNGERYVTPDTLTQTDIAVLLSGIQAQAGSFTTKLGEEMYLCVAVPGGTSGFILVGCKPMTLVNASLIVTRNGSIAIGLIALFLTVLVAEIFIRYITEPLNRLAHRLRRVGTGNFKTQAALEGSFELIGLSEDVNHMMNSIDGLIDQTYVATLNERTAQLIALEAQTNPHFLFNTLQAIGSEALTRGQGELYRMITALGSLLRYSIKGGNLASLKTELSHVEKYLLLQKARFGDRLNYRIDTAPLLMRYLVPKLGVLSLVENSIVHGLCDQVTSIDIVLLCQIEGEEVQLSVRDNGNGISQQKLTELCAALDDPEVNISQNVGLVNLASRLKLLYNGRARIQLTSAQEPRQTTVMLSIPLEVLKHVQSSVD